MMNQSKIRWPEMASFHALLVFEQILGSRAAHQLIDPLKVRLQRRMLTGLSDSRARSPEPVDRVQNLSEVEFHKRYLSRGRAVVFSGAAQGWPCCQKWNLDYFSVAYGHNDTLLVHSQGLTTRQERSDHQFLHLRELIEQIRQGGDRYLRFSPLLHENPALAEDLDLKWLGRMRGGRTFGHTYYMFMGGRGHKTYLHNDQPCNLYVQIYGEKKWTLFYPEDSVALYPQITNAAYVKSPIDLDAPDLDKFPLFRGARPYEVVLRPGDVLYVPPHVWHQVENLTDTIAVGYRFSSVWTALKSSLAFSLIRLLSTNPPVWKTRKYGQTDTNLIWAHANGKIEQVLHERLKRRKDAELSL